MAGRGWSTELKAFFAWGLCARLFPLAGRATYLWTCILFRRGILIQSLHSFLRRKGLKPCGHFEAHV